MTEKIMLLLPEIVLALPVLLALVVWLVADCADRIVRVVAWARLRGHDPVTTPTDSAPGPGY